VRDGRFERCPLNRTGSLDLRHEYGREPPEDFTPGSGDERFHLGLGQLGQKSTEFRRAGGTLR
jgi:hypothetical protein